MKILIVRPEPPVAGLALAAYEKLKQNNEVILIGNEMNSKLAVIMKLGMARLNGNERSSLQSIKEEHKANAKKIIPKGAKLYTFGDGFECFARTQEKADKKHEAWLNKA